MVKVIIISKKDSASLNIFENLLKQNEWQKVSKFQGNDVYKFSNSMILIINEFHIYSENLDRKIKNDLNIEIDCIIFASRHRSESGTRTLTVHPIGNFKDAKFGGNPETLVPSSPYLMTSALRILKRNAQEKNLDYMVSFEATHHGPFLSTPAFFIEIGSDENAWNDMIAGEVIAKTISEVINLDIKEKGRVAIGIGGGHYTPRHTDIALSTNLSFGHIIPSYAIDISDEILEKAISATPNINSVYFHRKAIKKSRYREMKDWFLKKEIDVVRKNDLTE